jgi:Fe-S oxidoreductase
MPQGHICCGRPLYDYGFLDVARRYLHDVIDQLRDEIRAGTPIVGMEPSCLAVFKDELTNMLPHDDDAERLKHNAHHFSEFFEKYDVPVPRLERKALMWTHCHHRATGGSEPERKLLTRMGVDTEPLKGGCCGLAGSWGFEQGKYDISMDCGEQALLPAVRAARDDTLIVANGFSCKTQIDQAGTGRRALHVAQVMQMARKEGPDGPRGRRPEKGYYGKRPKAPVTLKARRFAALSAVGAAAAVTATAVLSGGSRRR